MGSGCAFAAAMVLVLALSACGGGGSGDPQATPSGDGVSPGAVLYADATVLRPAAASSRWTYHGVHTPPRSAPVAYDDVVTHGAGPDGSVLESASNLFGAGTSSQQVRVAAGVSSTTAFDFAGHALPALATELRSAVRAGDEYTIVDQRGADAGADFDGDGRHDAVDFAVRRVVVGNESVTIANAGVVVALRVDTVFVVRLIASSNGEVAAEVRFEQSGWYAPGIGIVRQRWTSPPDDSGFVEVWDEVLTGYDGLTRGAGVNATQPAVVPQDGTAYAGLRIPGLIDALRLGDHVVVRTGKPGEPWSGGGDNAWPGMYFAVMDRRGNVMALRDYPTLTYFGAFTMLPDGTGFAEVAPPDASGQGQIFRFDDQARLVGPAAGTTYSLANPAYPGALITWAAVASDGNGFWVVGRRMYGKLGVGFFYQVVARHFDHAGQPLGSEVVLADDLSSDEGNFARIAVTDGRVAVTWLSPSGDFWAAWSEGDPLPVVHGVTYRLGPRDLWPVAIPSGRFGLLWTNTGPASAVGVALDGGGALVLPPGRSAVDGEAISPAWGAGLGGFRLEGGSAAGQLLASGTIRERQWPTDATDVPLLFVADYSVDGGALSALTPRVMKLAGSADATRVVAFDDRYLLLSGGLPQLYTTVIWR